MKRQERSRTVKNRRQFFDTSDSSKNIEPSHPFRGDVSCSVSVEEDKAGKKSQIKMQRPVLNEVPVAEVINALVGGKEARGGKGIVVITMSPGQWDELLSGAYDAGHTLLELDEHEWPVRAYRRKVAG